MLVIMVFCLYNLILNNIHDPSVQFPSLSYFYRPWDECSINYPSVVNVPVGFGATPEPCDQLWNSFHFRLWNPVFLHSHSP